MSARHRSSTPEAAQQTEIPERLWESRPGWIIRAEGEGRLLVDFEGNSAGPLVARTTVHLSTEELQHAIATRRPVELRFENGEPALPVVVGIAPAIPLEELLQSFMRPPEGGSGEEQEVRVIQGRDGLVLQCGKASITLRRNGKIILQGTYIEARSEGIHRLKGSAIQFN